ncbi:MAG: sulfurtransferase complex subunit TusC [Buchnera aphidicola (Chaetogeoica yunlongensis)]
MKKNISFVFSCVPHGISYGREGLDLLLSISLIHSNISVFFIGDGIFQLFRFQKPEVILSRNYLPSFKILPLFGITKFYLCKQSLKDRGVFLNKDFILDISILSSSKIRMKLNDSNLIINF